MNLAIDMSVVIGFAIVTLLGIIGYFLKRLIDSIDSMKESIEEIKTGWISQEEKLKANNYNCDQRHIIVDKTFENHDRRIEKVEKKAFHISG